MKKLILLLFCTIFMILFSLASVKAALNSFEVENNPNIPNIEDANPVSGKAGFNITLNQTEYLRRVTKFSGNNVTKAYIHEGGWGGTVVASASFVGDNATLDFELTSGVTYAILADAEGVVYDGTFVNNATNPTSTGIITWEIGINAGGNPATTFSRVFISMTLGPAPAGPIVTLNSPEDNANVTNATITFNSTIAPTTFNVTNATLSIWWSNGTIISTTTNTLTGSSANTTTFDINISTITDGYLWNVEGCQGNGNGINCTSVDSNRTFNIKKIIELSQNYNTPVIEQSSQDFKINVSLSEGFAISTVTLTYNNTDYSGSFITINSTTFQGEVTIIVPSVEGNVNVTFNWTIVLTDATSFISGSNNQIINDFGLDDCSSNTIQILNFTLVNEETQVKLSAVADNTSIKIDLNLFTNSTSTSPAFEFSQDYDEINPARVCVSNAIANSTYLMDAVIQYDATGFANEFYHLQSYELNATAGSDQNITLFDLNDSDAQEFIISFKDESFLAVSNALIQIQRKYVDEGVSKVVELPKTDFNGEVVGHLVLNDVIYSFTVVKDGVILASFGESFAVCQNPAIEDCIIDLNSFTSGIDVTEFSTEKDFSFTLTYNELTRTVSTTFSIPSGASAYVSLNVTKADALGTSICNTAVTTSAGTLSCVVANSFGNGTVLAEIYKNSVLVAQGHISLEQEPEDIYGASLVVLGLFIMLTLIGAGISDNPIYTVLFMMLGVILLFAMNLVDNTGFIGATSTILWLIMALVLIMIKAGRRN